MADEVASRCAADAGDGAGERDGEVGLDGCEGTGEGFGVAVEVDAHLEGEGPAGGVIGPVGRAAGVGEVVGVVLRLEHVEHLRAEGLRGENDVGARGIVLAVDVKGSAGLLDFDAGLHEAVDELGRGGEVGLVGGDDVAARVLLRGVVEDLVVEFGGDALGAWAGGVAGVGREYAGAVDVCAALFGFGFEGFDAFGCDGPVVFAAVLNGVFAHQIEVVEEVGALAGGIVEHGAVVGLLIGDGGGVVPELRLDGIDKVVARKLLG